MTSCHTITAGCIMKTRIFATYSVPRMSCGEVIPTHAPTMPSAGSLQPGFPVAQKPFLRVHSCFTIDRPHALIAPVNE